MVYASRLTPLEAILVGILVEHQKALAQLKAQIRQRDTEAPPSLAQETDGA